MFFPALGEDSFAIENSNIVPNRHCVLDRLSKRTFLEDQKIAKLIYLPIAWLKFDLQLLSKKFGLTNMVMG